MKASMAGAAATLAALPTQMARLTAALQAKREDEGGAPTPAGPSDDPTPNDGPVAAAATDAAAADQD
jgi:hypothetical protein